MSKYEHKNMTAAERTEITELLSGNGYALAADATDTVAWRVGSAPSVG